MNLLRLFASSLILLLISTNGFSQDDLLEMLGEEDDSGPQKVIASFKTTRVINAHSLENVKAKTLDFRITHRFGNIGTENGGIHSVYGLDNATNIRIAFEYGITDNLTAGFSRSKLNEHYEGLLKYRFLHQTTDNSVPVTAIFFTNAVINTTRDVEGVFDNIAHRMSYTFQAIVGRKFGSKLTLELLPTMVHRNLVRAIVHPETGVQDENDVFALGFGGRLKLSNRTTLVADYFLPFFSDYRNNNPEYYNPLAIGVNIETGGHVFSLNVTNTAGIIENDYIPRTTESWLDGAFKFGFNISRVFSL